jgi:hypothetical protein
MKKIICVLLVQLAALLGIDGIAAASGGANQRFFIVGRVEDPVATIAASGVITGVGSLTAESVEFRPADKTYHEIDAVAVGGGSLTLSIDGRFDVWPFDLDPRTCTQSGMLSGNWTITAAGGDFAGATGAGTFSGRFLTYARRIPGGCDAEAIKGLVAGPMVGNLRLIS